MNRHILALVLLFLSVYASSTDAGGAFTLDWNSIDGGGVMQSAGGSWTLSGTIGQSDATPVNALSAGNWQLTGGFWALIAVRLDALFADRFAAPDE